MIDTGKRKALSIVLGLDTLKTLCGNPPYLGRAFSCTVLGALWFKAALDSQIAVLLFISIASLDFAVVTLIGK